MKSLMWIVATTLQDWQRVKSICLNQDLQDFKVSTIIIFPSFSSENPVQIFREYFTSCFLIKNKVV